MAPARTQADDLSDLRLYTLEEVAEVTGLSLRSLRDGAAARRFEHVHRGKRFKRFMTAQQIRKLIDINTVPAASDEEVSSERDAFERNNRRRSGRRSLPRSA